jgi:uncharacterized protein YdaL
MSKWKLSWAAFVLLAAGTSASHRFGGFGIACAQPRDAASTSKGTLVLYDSSGDFGYLGELYATGVAALVSHFGAWSAAPAIGYRAGDINAFRAVIYIGSSYDEPLPQALLDDVRSGTRPVYWLGDNIWKLVQATPDFEEQFGYLPTEYSQASIAKVTYKNVRLDRDASAGPIMQYTRLNTAKAKVLGWAEWANGRQTAWAVRSKHLTYIGENPLAFIGPTDRYLAFCDLLFDLLAPATKERHRALVRIEDIHALTPPPVLRALADYFAGVKVPFSIAVIPVYTDPLGAQNGGTPITKALHEAPDVVEAIKYMIAKGATLVLHGYTHQYGQEKNPYTGTTVDDFEFFRAHVDADNNVVQDGPVAGDSAQWADKRIVQALAEMESAGLPRPEIFEYPHYGGSVPDSLAIASHFKTAYQRASYYEGALSHKPVNYAHALSMFFPFAVHDLYGWKVIPENLGNYIPVGYNNHAQWRPADLRRAAKLHRVVRDGVASFFFHPMYDTAVLREIVQGIQSEGYVFVAPDAL